MRGNTKKASAQVKKKHPKSAIYEEASKYPSKITTSHLPQIYHLTETCSSSKPHPNKYRNTNCTNPFCCLKVGLERWDKFKKELKPDEGKRDRKRDIETMPCGLYNNANLCYLNSFLQIWYHNSHFRRFVFSFTSLPTFVNPKNANGLSIKVQKIMERLQAVFFALELSPFEAADAVRLADALMLQDSQQDVSEFHTLFFNFLEKHLEGHPSLSLFKKVHEKVNFHTKQVLECKCGRKKEKDEVNAGLHLNPDGCTNVTGMIHKAFASIPLSDYRCPECHEVGNTVMKNVPVSLPPILIFQISRVSLDHRKDRTAIIYPRKLNESTLMKESKGNHKYHLHAVCVHDGTAASSGHYHDYILDTRRNGWFHFNDANVKSVRPPGVENESDTISKPPSDMRGCYLLLYRKDSDVAEDKVEVSLPKRANVIEKRLRIESERLRHSNERSEIYWYKRANEALSRVEKTINDLKISSLDFVKKKPHDVVFIPTSMIFDFIDKEYKAVETMVNLNKLEDTVAEERKQKRKQERAKEQAALEAGGDNLHQKYLKVEELTPEMIADIEKGTSSNEIKRINGRPKRTPKVEATPAQSNVYIADSSDESDVEEPEPDEDAYKHLYVPEQLGSYDMPICMHGKIPLTNLLQGELKAVKRQAAEKFVKAYGLQMKKKSINHLEGSNSGYSACQWLTAQDLCSECAQDLRKEALFSQSLDEIEPLLSEILKNPERAVGKDGFGPADMLFVSRKELTSHKQLALQQREYKRSLQQQKATFITFATKFPEVAEKRSLSPRPRKRKLTENEHEVIPPPPPPPSYQVKTDPTSPLKLKLCLSKPAPLSNGNTFKITPTKKSSVSPPKPNGIRNGKRCSSSPSAKRSHSTMSASESESDTEEEEEIESEDDPEWDGRETPPPGSRRKGGGYRAVGTPRKRKKPQKQNGGTPEKGKELKPLAEPVTFNSEIVCDHSKIRHGAKMVLISEAEWSKIVTPFFDEFYKFSADNFECDLCVEEKNQEAKSHQQNKEIVAQINADISILLKLLEKRKFLQKDLGTKYTNVICGRFLEQFRSTAKSRSSSVMVPTLCQGCLICIHRRPFVVLDPNGPTVANALPITKDEWNTIVMSYQRHYPGHRGESSEITLTADGACTNHCGDCYMAYCERENKKRFEYVDSYLYIKMKEDSGDSKKSSRALTTRRVAAKSTSRILVSSTQTVAELKVVLYGRLGISPNDMLMINGENVLEDDKTLGESRVPVNNEDTPLILIVQSHDDDPREIDRGFQDTALAF